VRNGRNSNDKACRCFATDEFDGEHVRRREIRDAGVGGLRQEPISTADKARFRAGTPLA
jgi:hypothetical protein